MNQTAPTWEELETMHPELDAGGHWRPSSCIPRSRVAIVIPYMNRDRNLRVFLQHMHPFLQKQQLEYGIFVSEPVGSGVCVLPVVYIFSPAYHKVLGSNPI